MALITPPYHDDVISYFRYSTKHFNDESTPKATKDLLSQ